MSTGIEWTDDTWNPVTGCDEVSAGCDHCYAKVMYERFNGKGSFSTVKLHSSRLGIPQRWRKPRMVFVNSMSDLFHKDVTDFFIAEVFAVMALTPRHTFQILTKRHARMRSLLSSDGFRDLVNASLKARHQEPLTGSGPVVLPNVWLGVSVENQRWADIRIPALRQTPAAVRWLSMEPLLGPVDLVGSPTRPKYWLTGGPVWGPAEPTGPRGILMRDLIIEPGVDWVVVGGESGHGARAMHPDWVRSLRDQCTTAGVPFFMKQWGAWGPAPWKVERIDGENDDAYKARAEATGATHVHTQNPLGNDEYHLYKPNYKPWSIERRPMASGEPYAPIRRWGKKKSGKELDGQVWDQYPQQKATVPA